MVSFLFDVKVAHETCKDTSVLHEVAHLRVHSTETTVLHGWLSLFVITWKVLIKFCMQLG